MIGHKVVKGCNKFVHFEVCQGLENAVYDMPRTIGVLYENIKSREFRALNDTIRQYQV